MLIMIMITQNIYATGTDGLLNQYPILKKVIITEFTKQKIKEYLYDTGKLIVKYTSSIRKDDMTSYENLHQLKNRKLLSDNLNLHLYDLPENKKLSVDILKEINESPLVEFAEPDYKMHLTNDPYYDKLYSVYRPEININAENTWTKTKGESSVVVAVIDSGVDYTHPDLKDNIWENTKEITDNGIDDDKNGYIDDVYGWNFFNNDNNPMDNFKQGTHVSGTIASGENGIGIVGVAPLVKIMPLKIFGDYGELSSYSDIILAINYAKENGAAIINMSFNGKLYSSSLYLVMASTEKENILFVTAAGNESSDNDIIPCYPASFDISNNICVASIDQKGALSYFSNYGKETVHIAAPGSLILSTVPDAKYEYMQGTSMAAAHVSGVAALIKSYSQQTTPKEIKDILIKGITPLPSLEGKIYSGGLINADKALELISSDDNNTDNSIVTTPIK